MPQAFLPRGQLDLGRRQSSGFVGPARACFGLAPHDREGNLNGLDGLRRLQPLRGRKISQRTQGCFPMIPTYSYVLVERRAGPKRGSRCLPRCPRSLSRRHRADFGRGRVRVCGRDSAMPFNPLAGRAVAPVPGQNLNPTLDGTFPFLGYCPPGLPWQHTPGALLLAPDW